MASISPMKETKDGKRYFEIRVRMGREGQTLSSRWYVPEGKAWSEGTIKKKVDAAAQEFERQCKAGEVKTKKQLREEQEQKALEDAKIPTFRQFVENEYLKEKASKLKNNSLQAYYSNLDRYIYDDIADTKLRDVSGEELEGILSKMIEKKLKLNTRIKVFSILRAIFKAAYKRHLISCNPMDEVERPTLTNYEENVTKVKAFNEIEVARILKCADKEPLKWRTLIYLLVYSGCRIGEAIGIKWNCVDYEAGSIKIEQTICYNKKFGLYTNLPKNKKVRTIYPDDKVFRLLAELQKSQKGKILTFNQDPHACGYVFTGERSNEVMNPYSTNMYFKQFAERNGIEDLHPHKLRHTFASISIKKGADIVSVAAALGDNPETILRTYAHDYEEGKRHTSNIFSQAIAINQ